MKALAEVRLTAGGVIAQFHRWRVLPLMESRLTLDQVQPGYEPAGTQMGQDPLADDIAIQRARRAVDKLQDDPFVVPMRPEDGYLQFISGLFRPL